MRKRFKEQCFNRGANAIPFPEAMAAPCTGQQSYPPVVVQG